MAQYNIGNVTLYNASTQVVGASCDWLTANAVQVGDMFKKTGENAWYNITAVQTATRISISPAYGGSNASAVPYAITRDFTPNINLPEVSAGDLDWQDSYTRAVRIIDRDIISYSVIRGETYQITSGSGRFGWAVGHHPATPGMVAIANASSGGDAIPAIGVIASDNGTTVQVYYRGPLASYPNSFTAGGGTRYYLKAWNTTATYNLSNEAPTTASYIVQFIGTNKSATALGIDIQENYIEL